jgi:hypothetical protein
MPSVDVQLVQPQSMDLRLTCSGSAEKERKRKVRVGEEVGNKQEEVKVGKDKSKGKKENEEEAAYCYILLSPMIALSHIGDESIVRLNVPFRQRKNSFLSTASHWAKCTLWGINLPVPLVTSPGFCKTLTRKGGGPTGLVKLVQQWESVFIRKFCIFT